MNENERRQVMNEYEIEYELIAKGKLTLFADTPDQARAVMKSIKEFELYDDSTSAKVKIKSLVKKEE